jgi:DNA topoisomerase VI subunit B
MKDTREAPEPRSATTLRAKIERTAFRTSRALDFLSAKDLAAQCGHGPESWILVLVKELLDNAIDACEEQGVAPEIAITIDDDSMTVTDNGAGIPPDLVELLLDFSLKVSSREAYVAPDRGAQGNALKTIVAMPFVLDGEEGRVEITGGGVKHEIVFSVDRIAQRPVAEVSRSPEAGSQIRVWWPTVGASSDDRKRVLFLQEQWLDDPAEVAAEAESIRDLAVGFTFLNPHVTLTLDTFGEVWRTEATDTTWQKWTPSSPTSPHWYEPEHLERLLGAYITHDRQNGNRERTVREFLAEFRGLTSTIKQRQVLAELGLAREPLSSLLTDGGRDFDHERVARLLAAMKAQTKPVPPKHLGVIGREHIAARFLALGMHPESFEYTRVMSLGEHDGLPQVTEVGFAVLRNQESRRKLITGVNWSAAWINPFRDLGDFQSLDTILANRRLGADEPVALLVHVAHPRVTYTDRGKSTVLARSRDITETVEGVGKKWTRQIKAEERHSSARQFRQTVWSAPARVSLKEIVYDNLPEAWDKASDGGRLPTHWRQIFYVTRPICDADPDADRPLRDATFKKILEDYLADYAPRWDVLRGARGVFKEPHRAADDNGLAMSTMNVRTYVRAPQPSPEPGEIPRRFPTHGARNRIAAVLICEKEGFDELLEAEQIPERYDLALMSTKGISALAARDLAESTGVPCFTLHDLDKNGFVMRAGFPFATDLGIRFDDVTEWALAPEGQAHKNPARTAENLRTNGATQQEIDFIAFQGQRVELNMLTGRQFIEFVEQKMQQHGVRKVVPDGETLQAAWNRAIRVSRINMVIRGDQPTTALNAPLPPAPDDLADRIRDAFEQDDSRSWDEALWDIAGDDRR